MADPADEQDRITRAVRAHHVELGASRRARVQEARRRVRSWAERSAPHVVTGSTSAELPEDAPHDVREAQAYREALGLLPMALGDLAHLVDPEDARALLTREVQAVVARQNAVMLTSVVREEQADRDDRWRAPRARRARAAEAGAPRDVRVRLGAPLRRLATRGDGVVMEERAFPDDWRDVPSVGVSISVHTPPETVTEIHRAATSGRLTRPLSARVRMASTLARGRWRNRGGRRRILHHGRGPETGLAAALARLAARRAVLLVEQAPRRGPPPRLLAPAILDALASLTRSCCAPPRLAVSAAGASRADALEEHPL